VSVAPHRFWTRPMRPPAPFLVNEEASMHPIIEASRLMNNAQITRKAAIHANATTIFLWELSTGDTLELVRTCSGFSSTELKHHPFNDRINYYQERRSAKVTGSYQPAA
ncbi:hypothetical protein, partial [Pseudomonas helleri]|uniref:hypothetical protein n=1 Tax=Pseudomonas helleri TaxID=1608996 RepID=UPI001E2AA7EC